MVEKPRIAMKQNSRISKLLGTSDPLIRALIIVGAFLRLVVAVVNGEANDDHMSVIRTIADQNRFPATNELWEAFQPKLYHTTVAMALKLSPFRAPWADIRIAQIISAAASVLTLLALAAFLRDSGISRKGQRIGVALAATTAGLVAIGGQATNDSFVILFASLALIQGCAYFRAPTLAALTRFAVCTALAVLSKGNGLVLLIAATSAFLGPLFIREASPVPSRRRVALQTACFLVLTLGPIGLFGPYRDRARAEGSPFATNLRHSPLPALFAESIVDRPGLTSLAHGLATFRLLDLLAHPKSTDHRTRYPRHRTSLWSRAYAQTVFAQFESWPPTWETKSAAVLTLGRVLLILGLAPLALLTWGLVSVTWRTIKILLPRNFNRDSWSQLFLVLCAWGYLAFAAAYAVKLRDFSSMKAIFIYPAIVAFIWIIATTVDSLEIRLDDGSWLKTGLPPLIAAFVVASCLDVISLVYQLSVFAKLGFDRL
jgi:hypothetical protein